MDQSVLVLGKRRLGAFSREQNTFTCTLATLPHLAQCLWLFAVAESVKYLALYEKARLYSDRRDADIACVSLFDALPQSRASPRWLQFLAA
jgi:hypothetical protein